jgi:hypothetical protein
METTMTILNNVAHFINYLPLESQSNHWSLVLHELETLFRQLEPLMVKSYDYTCIFLIMQTLLKVSTIANNKVDIYISLDYKTKELFIYFFVILDYIGAICKVVVFHS